MPISIAIEGPEGSGKSQLLKTTAQLITETTDFPVLTIQEPGGTLVGEAIRHILLQTPTFKDMDPGTQLLLFTAARYELFAKVITPFIHENPNGIIIADRSWMSTFALQSNDGANPEYIHELQKQFMGYPDFFVYMALPPEESVIRIAAATIGRETHWRDQVGLDTFTAIRSQYLKLIAQERHRTFLVDGFASPWRTAVGIRQHILASTGATSSYAREELNAKAEKIFQEGVQNNAGMRFEHLQDKQSEARRDLNYPSQEELHDQMLRDWRDRGLTAGIILSPEGQKLSSERFR